MAELGDTNDPTALISGSPEVVWEHAHALRAHSVRLTDTGDGLKRVKVGTWSGDAGNAFHDSIAEEPPKWYRASDAVAAAADTVDGYGDTLKWAQDRAAEAIRLWEQGEEATQRARSAHAADVAKADAEQAASDPAAEAPAVAFDDPGETYRQQAAELLSRARGQLDEKGHFAAGLLATHTSSATGQVGLGESAHGETRLGGDTLSGDASVLVGAQGTASASANPGGATAQANGSIGADDRVSGRISGGPAVLSGDAEVSAGMQGEASASIGILGAGVSATGFIGEKAAAGLDAQLGPAEASVDGEALSGAEAEVDGAFGLFDGINADVFVGQKVDVSGHEEIAGVGAGAEAGVSDGIGANIGGHVGYHDGEFTISGDLGATLGIGGDVSGQITIDPGKMWETLSDAPGVIEHAGGDAVDAVEDGAGAIKDGVSGAADKVKGVFKKLSPF